jgi:hypothetical protein
VRAFALVLVAGCGSGPAWTDAQTKTLTNAARAQLMVETLCAGEAGCKASEVRALERVSYCDSASVLVHFGKPAPSSAIACRPP